ncbi:MAG: dTDP-glucose 4,6-dehydratase [Candidatus Omnitrophota bacterium]|nr:dTDP-glucose 4,6-dehydratase [Candidatus Omnitrophota bacterium]
MRKRIPKILVTGGAGFIASAFARSVIARSEATKQSPFLQVIVVDNLTYAGDLKRLGRKRGLSPKGTVPFFYKVDICDKKQIARIFKKEKPDIVVNFAAETHVDRSILDGDKFLTTNILGTQNLLEAAKEFGISRFVHISTDEVYGDIKRGRFTENSPLNPSSPYSASKASADLLVKSYIRTYKFPAIIVRPSNNYGPWQYPEKLIPVIIYKAIKNEKVPIYAKGLNVREWLYVDDCASAISKILEKGKPGEIYNIGSGNECKNIEVVKKILDILGKPHSLIKFVQDRPGHDIRYSLDSSKIRRELGWSPEISFDTGIKKTVNWYVANFSWLETKAKILRNYWKKVYK